MLVCNMCGVDCREVGVGYSEVAIGYERSGYDCTTESSGRVLTHVCNQCAGEIKLRMDALFTYVDIKLIEKKPKVARI